MRSKILASVFALLASPAHAGGGDMVWQFSESNDPSKKAPTTARLIYGVPETDFQRASAVCEAKSSTAVRYSVLSLGTEVGTLANGQQVEVRFSGGGFYHVAKGQVQRPETEEGLSGVALTLAHDDPLWAAMSKAESLDYLVPGYRAATLEFRRGQANIKEFVETCRAYAVALDPNPGARPAPQPTPKSPVASVSSTDAEKAAFSSAKELGTADAWKAFLKKYPSGFHADLARAYLKKQENANVQPPAAAKPRDLAMTGYTLTRLRTSAGEFIKKSSTTWLEQRRGERPVRYVQTSRSADDVTLYDASRRITLRFDIPGRSIWHAQGREKPKVIYEILEMSAGEAAKPATAKGASKKKRTR